MGRMYRHPAHSVYYGWWQGWAPALFMFVLVGCLIYAAGIAHRANETAANLQGQLAMDAQLLGHGEQDRARLQADVDRLVALTPTERLIVTPCPPPHDRKRVTPVFSRDSQFIWVQR